ncbi:MAG TPA: HAD family phosphatase [Bryobacterales bacterium]|nr:HAD family phosphatase [Bryobacterales bacterium]
MGSSIRAIFFDFDGVLVDSEPVHYECWAEVLAGYAMPLEWDFYNQNFIGSSDRDMIQVLCERFGRSYDAGFFRQCYGEKTKLYEQRARGRLAVPEELVLFILTSFKTFDLGVVSSSSRCEVEPHLAGRGIRRAITALVCREDVERCKPDPEPYLRALDIVNAQADGRGIAAAECLVVEDSEPGAEAGQRAGMRVLRVPGPVGVLGMLEAELRRG